MLFKRKKYDKIIVTDKKSKKGGVRLIKLCGVSLSQLPERRELVALLDDALYRSWCEHHKSVRDDRMARASLGGVLLLQTEGYRRSFLYDSNGRPFFENEEIDFNITHTDQAVFCAIETRQKDAEASASVLRDHSDHPVKEGEEVKHCQLFEGQTRVGIDAEDVRRLSGIRTCPMASRWFSEQEYDLFMSDPSDLTFLRIWTRKEALMKWTGKGLRDLRLSDTVTAPRVYGVRFYEYMVDSTLVTLCCHAYATPPPAVHMYSSVEWLHPGTLSL